MEVGFVILSHNNPQQVLRLVECLDRVYGRPPIAIHHDTHQSPIDVQFPDWVAFVDRPERTRWAQFSLVRASLRALELLYSRARPDWFFLLSGADYPIRGADDVRGYLAAIKADALIDLREVPAPGDDTPLAPPANPSLSHLISPKNAGLAYRRYIGLNLWVPIIRSGPRLGRYTFYTTIQDWRAPFDTTFRCYYGDYWFAGNAKAAALLLAPTARHRKLQRYLSLRTVPDECYYQTILGNSGLALSPHARRFAKWMGGGAHPRTLEADDFPLIRDSGDFFARKFAPDNPILDLIDAKLLAESAAAPRRSTATQHRSSAQIVGGGGRIHPPL